MPSVEEQYKVRPDQETDLSPFFLPFIHAYRDDGIANFGREQVISFMCKDKVIEEIRVDIAHGNASAACWDACQAALLRHSKECEG